MQQRFMRCLISGMSSCHAPALVVAALLCGCALPSARTKAPGVTADGLQTRLTIEPAEFALADRREVGAVYSVVNKSRKAVRLEFPTEQRVEFALSAPDGRRIFLWSEDRLFAPAPSTLVVNPGEKLEYAAALPTRDMAAGRRYAAKAFLHGRPDTVAQAMLLPR